MASMLLLPDFIFTKYKYKTRFILNAISEVALFYYLNLIVQKLTFSLILKSGFLYFSHRMIKKVIFNQKYILFTIKNYWPL